VADITKDQYQRLAPLEPGYYPSWSSDGRYLAWFHPDSSIRVWDRDSQSIVQYDSDYYPDFHYERGEGLAWSPDNTSIFLQGPGFRLDLLTASFNYEIPIEDGLEQCCFTYSPSGDYIALISNGALLVYSQSGERIIFRNIAVHPLAWSPDGNILAWGPGGYFENVLALTFLPNGDTQYIHISDESSLDQLTWSPDSRSITAIGYNTIHRILLEIDQEPFQAVLREDTTFKVPNIFTYSSLSLDPHSRYIAYDGDDNWVALIDNNGIHLSIKDLLPNIKNPPNWDSNK
jgi:hypothetical protein